MDSELISRCRDRLIEVARRQQTTTFSELAAHLGIENRGSWDDMLDQIHDEETAAGRPDLTLLIVYSDTGYPPFISRGGPARSVRFDPNNTSHLKDWAAELNRIYERSLQGHKPSEAAPER